MDYTAGELFSNAFAQVFGPWILAFALLAGFIFLLAFIIWLVKRHFPNIFRRFKNYPYSLKESLLTSRELHFYGLLHPAADAAGLVVAIKPRMADFINVTAKQFEKNSGYHTHLNRITGKHIDFLLCDKLLRPVLGFELDDNSHQRADRMKRDDFVNDVYRTIGLDVYRIDKYTSHSIEQQIHKTLAGH